MIENTFFDTLNDFLPLNKKLDDEEISERTSQLFEKLRIFNVIMDRVRFMFRVEVESFFFSLSLAECETSSKLPYAAYNF